MREAAAAASVRRTSAISSAESSADPQSPGVMVIIVMLWPAAASSASAPPARISTSSGCACIARIFVINESFWQGIRYAGIMKVPLSDLAHTRSGDKGDTANIGVIAWRERDYPILVREVTAERVKAHFGEMVKG